MASSTTQNIGTAVSQAVMPNRASVLSQANSLQASTRTQVQAANHAITHKLGRTNEKEEKKRPVSLKKEVAPTYSPQNLRQFGKDPKVPQEVANQAEQSNDYQEPIDITV
jgi:hypothetical protein